MNVKELLRELSYGELSNLALSESGSGNIVETKVPTVIQAINDALLALYTKYTLKETSLTIELLEARTLYPLRLEYAVSEGGSIQFIQDTSEEPFPDDVLKILEVWDVYGISLHINDRDDITSVFTPQPDVLQVVNPVVGNPMTVIYQASHATLSGIGSKTEIEAQDIVLPVYLKAPLRAYVAYQIFDNMGGQDNLIKAAKHLSMYEKLCSEVTDKDLPNQSISSTDTKFTDRGFV